MEIEFVVGARAFDGEELVVDVKGGGQDDACTERLDGVEHLGLWSRSFSGISHPWSASSTMPAAKDAAATVSVRSAQPSRHP